MGMQKAIAAARARLAAVLAKTSRGHAAQRERWEARNEVRKLTGTGHRCSKKGHARGAFGRCRGPFDRRPPQAAGTKLKKVGAA